MEPRHSSPRMKPILIPSKITLKCKYTYQQFLRKRPKIVKEIQIQKRDTTDDGSKKYYSNVVTTLKRIFKDLKFIRKLDLKKLELHRQSIYQPKLIAFAKKLRHTQAVLINDKKSSKNDLKGISDPWIKFLKGTQHFSYLLDMQQVFKGLLFDDQTKKSNFHWRFPHLLRYQRRLKDLALSFDSKTAFYLHDLLFNKYPVALQRLSLVGLHSEKPITASLRHLKNLKHLDFHFHHGCEPDIMISAINLLPQIASNLQSLSFCWPDHHTHDIIPAYPALKTLTNLTHLKLLPACYTTFQFAKILDVFYDLPLLDLTLVASIYSEEDLVPINNFLKKFHSLESLKLKVQSLLPFSNRMQRVTELFRVIDDMVFMKNLCVSLNATPQKNAADFSYFHLPLAHIFTKPISLESFRVEIKPLRSGSQGFWGLLNTLKLLAPGLKKLRIDIGEYIPKSQEYETILGFIGSLKNVRSLRLESLAIPEWQFFMDFAQVLSGHIYLRTLTLGEGKKMSKLTFVNIVEEILKKRGLKTFRCQASEDLEKALLVKLKRNVEIDLGRVRRRNIELVSFPALPIFSAEEGKGEYENWLE